MREYGFSLTRILPYKDSVLKWENVFQWKPLFSHILCTDTPFVNSIKGSVTCRNFRLTHTKNFLFTHFFNAIRSFLWSDNSIFKFKEFKLKV